MDMSISRRAGRGRVRGRRTRVFVEGVVVVVVAVGGVRISAGGVAKLRLTIAALLERGVLSWCSTAILFCFPRIRLTGAHEEEEERRGREEGRDLFTNRATMVWTMFGGHDERAQSIIYPPSIPPDPAVTASATLSIDWSH
jgi:hypothetical protein